MDSVRWVTGLSTPCRLTSLPTYAWYVRTCAMLFSAPLAVLIRNSSYCSQSRRCLNHAGVDHPHRPQPHALANNGNESAAQPALAL